MTIGILDIETTPVPKVGWPEKIHCLVIFDFDTLTTRKFVADHPKYLPLEFGVSELLKYTRLVGHKIASFDIPVLQHFFPIFREWHGQVLDTLAVSRMAHYATLEERSKFFREREVPEKREAVMPVDMIRRHTLESWGYRLRVKKKFADVDESFYEQFSEELLERCESDVRLNYALFAFLMHNGAMPGWPICSERSMLWESEAARVLGKMERNGVGFDSAKAAELCSDLADERERLIKRLREQVPPWYRYEFKTPKRTRTMRKGLPYPVKYGAGAEHGRRIAIEFNPASPTHRAKVLMEQYGWEPTKQTDAGAWVTDEDTLRDLPYPIIPDLLRFMTVTKRLGQISEGKWAWLKCEVNGRIHGAVHATGTRTSRGAHFWPNLGQVPRTHSMWGPECREMFRPTQPGWLQVGVDAKALELRLLGHRLHPYDEGRFIEAVTTGDVHVDWMKITGLVSRDRQKELTYAVLYGAGDYRIGMIYLADLREAGRWSAEGKSWRQIQREARRFGKVIRKKLRERVPGLDALLKACAWSYERGYWVGLDGRVMRHKSEHGALNDVLQSDGAIVMKYAMVGADGMLRNTLGTEGWGLMLWVHDEFQFECHPSIAEPLVLIARQSIEEAGKALGVRCPMEGDVKVGKTWRDTH